MSVCLWRRHFASKRTKVVGFDIDQEKLDLIEKGAVLHQAHWR